MANTMSIRPPPEREYLSAALPFHSSPSESACAAVPAPVSGVERPHGASHDLAEKYSHLKRRYFDLEGKLKETRSELDHSMKRNTTLRSERSMLLDRIIELEDRNKLFESHLKRADPAFLDHSANGYSVSGAFPSTFITQRSRAAFMSNLQRARDELDNEDPSGEPSLTPHHVSSFARKRTSEELERRHDDDLRELKRSKSNRSVASSVATAGPLPTLLSESVEVVEDKEGTGNGLNTAIAAISVTDTSPLARVNSSSGSGLASPAPAPSPSKSARLRIKTSRSGVPDIPFSTGAVPPTSPPRQYLLPREERYTPDPSLTPLEPNEARNAWYSEQDYFRHASHAPNSTEPLPPLAPPPHASSSPRTVRPQSPRPQAAPVPTAAATQAPPPTMLTISAPRPSELQRQTKPKRLKAHTVTSKSYSIPTVPRDRQSGRPLLPLTVGIMTVVKLGEVCLREHFHTERYIFPIGYEVKRRYLSTQDANAEVVYHCTILDGGDAPKFQITATDMPPDKPIIAGTATGAWSGIVRAANMIRKRQHSNSVSGPDYFGLGQNTIKHLIQELPGANQLKNYVWQNFVEGGPLGGRHAAVVPALPEEYDVLPPMNTHPVNPPDHDREREKERAFVSRRGEPASVSGASVMFGSESDVASGAAVSQVNSSISTSSSDIGSVAGAGSSHDLVTPSRESERFSEYELPPTAANGSSPSLHASDRIAHRSSVPQRQHSLSPIGSESDLDAASRHQASISPATYLTPPGGRPGSSSSASASASANSAHGGSVSTSRATATGTEYSKTPSSPGTVRPTLASIMHSYPATPEPAVHRNGHGYGHDHGHHVRTPFKTEGTMARA